MKGKILIIAKFHRTDLVICSHSRERKPLSYSRRNTVCSMLVHGHLLLISYRDPHNCVSFMPYVYIGTSLGNAYLLRPDFFYFLVLGSADPNFLKTRIKINVFYFYFFRRSQFSTAKRNKS